VVVMLDGDTKATTLWVVIVGGAQWWVSQVTFSDTGGDRFALQVVAVCGVHSGVGGELGGDT